MGWERIQQGLAEAAVWIAGQEAADGGAAITLPQATLEAVLEIDSSQPDAIAVLGAAGKIDNTDDGRVRLGKLQRLEQLRSSFFGDPVTGEGGLLEALRNEGDELLAASNDDEGPR
jgi:hypothetical protein